MRILIDGQSLPVKNIDTARIRSVAELQQQTGWKLPYIRSTVNENEAYSAAVLTFLSMRDAELRTTWDEVLDRNFDDIKVVTEPGDFRSREAATADPQMPSGASAPDDASEAEDAPTED